MAYYEESLAISREIGSKVQMANTTGNMANLLSPRGDLARARTLYEEALAISREIGDKTTSARTLGNLSLVLVKQGDIPAAIKACEQAVLLSREVGERKRGRVCAETSRQRAAPSGRAHARGGALRRGSDHRTSAR